MAISKNANSVANAFGSRCVVSQTTRLKQSSSFIHSQSSTSSLRSQRPWLVVAAAAAASHSHPNHNINHASSKKMSSVKENLEKSKTMHQAMEDVLVNGKTTTNLSTAAAATAAKASNSPTAAAAAAKEAEKARQARYQQSLINVAFSFFTIVLAAQVLKSALERRRLERALQQATETTVETRLVLKTIQSPAFLRHVAHQIAATTNTVTSETNNNNVPSNSGSWWDRRWFGFNHTLNATPATTTTTAPAAAGEEQIYQVLRDEMNRQIGQASMTHDEKDKTSLDQLQEQAFEELQGDELLKELQALQVIQDETSGTTVVKKRIFTI